MIFPFTAIVGQDEMKTGLILNIIDPSIGGLLVMGEKGTAKSTAVRALAKLLPEISVVKGCPFSCDPKGQLCGDCKERLAQKGGLEEGHGRMRVVELPLGVTEDRLVGSLDIERALSHGEKRFEPGILAEANRSFLYVDEVNLLEDHIVDLLLDSAAMGVNTVEREGISFSHPSRFILVGTMNPEEGELRPQLTDRFGLSVHVSSIRDKALRVEVLKRKAAFDAAPEAFMERWRTEQEAISRQISEAKERVKAMALSDETLERIVEITTSLSLDGHRADIVIMKASRALAALRGKDRISMDEIREAASLSLGHRLRRLPFEEASTDRLSAVLAGIV
ncbi:MAG: AAA domain-containing protein [Nitrospirales bacterium]|nr:AAA domain-containing protein [Nitrospirales bacterium]